MYREGDNIKVKALVLLLFLNYTLRKQKSKSFWIRKKLLKWVNEVFSIIKWILLEERMNEYITLVNNELMKK